MADFDEPVADSQAVGPASPARSFVDWSSADLLMHVEVPVSVSLGRTRMRMKELLGLTQGSVVELEDQVGDEVEIRVNQCVIAHGEVVAVDGNYGVRITRMPVGANRPRTTTQEPAPGQET
jgi:flagellar motor switch protein FliN/FliY